MKVLWFSPYPLSRIQPLPVKHDEFHGEHPAPWIVNLSLALMQHYPQVELHIATINPWVKRPFSMEQEGIQYHVCKAGTKLPFGKYWPPLQWNIITRFRNYRSLLCKVSEIVKPDVVHAFGTESSYAVAAKDCGIPYLIYVQGILHKLSEVFPEDRSYSRRIILEKEAFSHCRYYAAETAFGAEFVHQTVPLAKIWKVSNSVSEPYFKVRHNGIVNRRLLFVGRMAPPKGVCELLAAAELNGWRLTMVGENRNHFSCELMEKYRHNTNIQWKGMLPIEEVAALMGEHDAFVLPSYMDTSPYGVAEAMAAGLPVVATRVGGIPDMVADGETGILIKPKSVDSLVRGITQLYADSKQMLKMGVEAKRVALKNFTPERNIRILMDAYGQIINEHNESTK